MAWAAAIPAAISVAQSLFGKKGGGDGGQMEAQMLMAQQGIQWRVADAQKAGIHPLYALGASLPSFTPVSVGDSGGGVADRLAAAGQDIGRAVESAYGHSDQAQARLQALTIQRAELENTMLASQIAKINQPTQPPPFPLDGLPPGSVYAPIGDRGTRAVTVTPLLPGQGNSGQVEIVPSEVVSSRVGSPFQEAGNHPYNKFIEMPNGELLPLPGKGMNLDDIDLSNPVAMEWWFRNRVLPNFNESELYPPPDRELPRGALGWQYNPRTGGYSPYYSQPKPGASNSGLNYKYRPRGY